MTPAFIIVFITLSFSLIGQLIVKDKRSSLFLRIRSWSWMLSILLCAVGIPNGLTLLWSVIALLASAEIYRNTQLARGWTMPLCVSLLTALHLGLFITLALRGETLLLVLLLLLTQGNDVLQYLCGKRWGKHKLYEAVSPNKTQEGAIGGVLFSTLLAGFIAPWLLEISPLRAASYGALLSSLGIAGDLLVSAYKRQQGIKDMGTLIPGHGGILDRIDSLLLSTPALWLILWA
ncbi:phosphatidate cytidylyltransferase [Thaumasiovibrio subtropicus]|uniref:phosphatidate cytidylyltransferase n=1 Tax=Thaumasiovibrio subtropicus TaxID=1891207 RepID=UPI000B356247|nr:phosphatidate cytidylyltransferase [Thaumasiovibrio subtropicus]